MKTCRRRLFYFTIQQWNERLRQPNKLHRNKYNGEDFSRQMDILYIIIPAYNESANIEHVLADWYPVIEKHNGTGASRLVIINDGSQDDTYTPIRKSMEKHLCSLPLRRKMQDTALQFSEAINIRSQNADFIFRRIPTDRRCR